MYIYIVEDKKPSIRYLLLNPAIYFANIIKECRSVIIAGGTMQPVSEFKDQLFQTAEVNPEQIVEFSCGESFPATFIYVCRACDWLLDRGRTTPLRTVEFA